MKNALLLDQINRGTRPEISQSRGHLHVDKLQGGNHGGNNGGNIGA
jgi:hypothetical protein